MSIQEALKDQASSGELHRIDPIIPSPSMSRSVWLAKQAFEQLDPFSGRADLTSAEAGRLRRKLENLAAGKRVMVGGRRNKLCDIKRLDPQQDEVWEIRERENGIRVFFRFVEKDCVAGMNLRTVSDLFSLIWRIGLEDFFPVWSREINNCKAKWRNLFFTYEPLSGVKLDEYISEADDCGFE